MPGGDRSGPEGMGPLTGRRKGFCAGYDVPGYANPGFGFQRGHRHRFVGGRGMGFRHRFGQSYTENYPEVSEKNMLEAEIRGLKEQLTLLEKRLSELKPGEE